jgi:hypothetical protein
MHNLLLLEYLHGAVSHADVCLGGHVHKELGVHDARHQLQVLIR